MRNIEKGHGNMKKLVTVLGARPQFIKAAVLSRIIQQRGEIQEVIVHTGQHFDDNMSEIFFRELGIPRAVYNLDVNQVGHGAMTGRMMERLEPVLERENPDLVLVYGDTNSTLAGALVARKMGVPVAHVEAGLRSGNMEMPEEINRIVTDRISDLLFCPTEQAIKNLESEGFGAFDIRIVQSGDIMKDSVAFFKNKMGSMEDLLERYALEGESFVLATIHRQENTDDRSRLCAIFEGLDKISINTPVVMPLHPRTKAAMTEFDIETNIVLIDPVGYASMQQLLHFCELVITDSGGLQKEAFFHKKPCLVVRPQTEWVELIDRGLAELVEADVNQLVASFQQMRNRVLNFDLNLYGTNPGETIYRKINQFLD
jgi:UDP-GlcNAc3NAcA epimerase